MTPLAACPSNCSGSSRVCPRCADQTAAHMLLDCPSTAPARASAHFAPLFTPPLPPTDRIRTLMRTDRHYTLASYVHECIVTPVGIACAAALWPGPGPYALAVGARVAGARSVAPSARHPLAFWGARCRVIRSGMRASSQLLMLRASCLHTWFGHLSLL